MPNKIILLFIISLFINTGCSTIKPDAEIRAIDPAEAKQWAEKNKDDANARLFTIHSENKKELIKWLTSLGIKPKFIK